MLNRSMPGVSYVGVPADVADTGQKGSLGPWLDLGATVGALGGADLRDYCLSPVPHGSAAGVV